MTIHLELIALQQVASIMLQDRLACRWGAWIVIRVIISNLDYFHYLLTRSSSATRP